MNYAKLTPSVVFGLIDKYTLAIWATLALFLMACTASGLLGDGRRIAQEDMHATVTAEAMLTETYGGEVSKAIEKFELQWHSLEAHTDPNIESEVATDPFLSYRGIARFGEAIYD
jgi:hypothetical protein